MPRTNAYKKETIDKVVKVYSSGLSVSDTSIETGYSEYTVKRILLKAGVFRKDDDHMKNVVSNSRCKKCVYSTDMGKGMVGCMYIVHNKCSRPCPAENCTVFRKGPRLELPEADNSIIFALKRAVRANA